MDPSSNQPPPLVGVAASPPSDNSAAHYHDLVPEKISATIQRLVDRIDARFPSSSLGQAGRRLLIISRQAAQRSADIDRPSYRLRIAGACLAVLIVVCSVGALLVVPRDDGQRFDIGEFIQVLEAGLNDLVLIGAAVFFLFTLERRHKRQRALMAVHELRALAHIIDMHQLAKDPERVAELAPAHGLQPVKEKDRLLTRFELGRYLDYCSEMLSLTSKIAALYVQRFDDPVALGSVNEVEALCTGLTRKIWQKIMILHADESRTATRSASGGEPTLR
jgi:hypothetical protein